MARRRTIADACRQAESASNWFGQIREQQWIANQSMVEIGLPSNVAPPEDVVDSAETLSKGVLHLRTMHGPHPLFVLVLVQSIYEGYCWQELNMFKYV
ncbi:hypothetical protein DPMN_173142 [Dreissena polymorpha]|uniref:Uncharacterized protein n=1 Tax=Dreissena polymorpha TaxID=45954 RepID=A0A9D4IHA7_DREPO|nr:hypothetical protein DPMN_173142 [Dreissena polymorpha]